MSIAELIMQGTNQTSNSMAGIGDSLAKLGQNVGAALAQKEQQKQAQAMLPYLQQSMQESMQLAQDGDTAGAYSNMMGVFASNPNLMQNQAVLPYLTMGLKGLQESAAVYKQKQDYDQRQAYYDSVLAKKTGGGGGVDIQGMVDTMNNGSGDVLAVDETVNPEGINPVVAGRLPGMQIPTESIQTQRGTGMTPKGIAAQTTPAPTATPQTRDQIDAVAASGLPATTPTAPGVGAVKGVNPQNALFPDLQSAPPPKNILEKFIKFEDKFAALPFEKQKAEMDNNSIIFPDKKMLENYKPAKGRGIIELSPEAGIGVPGLTGAVEIPESYKQFIVGSVNINPSTGSRSYSLRPEVENDPKAKAALEWLQNWQNASIEVNSNPDLRNLLSQAGNDALAVDVKPLGKTSGFMGAESKFELSVKGKPETKMEVPKETADQIKMLRSQTGAANVHNAKFIRLKSTTAPQTATPKTEYKSADDVKSAVKSGALTREQAMGILKSQFGYQ